MSAPRHCDQAREAVQLYLDGEADQPMCQAAAAHLQACPACAEDYEEERRVKALLQRSCGCESAPARLREQVLARLGTIMVTQQSSHIVYSDGMSVTYVETHTTTVETWEN